MEQDKSKLDKVQFFVDKFSSKKYNFKVRFSNYDYRSPPYIVEARNGNKRVAAAIDGVNEHGVTESFGPISGIVGLLTKRLQR